MNQKTISLSIGALAVIAVVAFAVFGDLKGLEQIGSGNNSAAVALVNGEEISENEFNSRVAQTESLLAAQGQSAQLEDPTVRSQMEQQILDQMILETLLLQKAEEQGVSVSSAEVDQEISNLVEQVGGQEAFEAQLNEQNISESQLRSDIEQQLITQQFLEANVDVNSVEVTDEEARAFYDEVAAQQEGLPPFEDIEQEVHAQIMQQKQAQLVNVYAQQLRSEAEVEVLL